MSTPPHPPRIGAPMSEQPNTPHQTSTISEIGGFNGVTFQVETYANLPDGEPLETMVIEMTGVSGITEIRLRQIFEEVIADQPHLYRAERSSTRWGGAGDSLLLLAQLAAGGVLQGAV